MKRSATLITRCFLRNQHQSSSQQVNKLSLLRHQKLTSLSPHHSVTSSLRNLSTQVGVELPQEQEVITDPLSHPDFFGVEKLVTVEDLFKARVHFGHTVGSRNEHMKSYLFGSRMNTDIFDLDVTLQHMHCALNFIAHIAYLNGAILFIMKSHQHGHQVEVSAKRCGEYAHTRPWKLGQFTGIQSGSPFTTGKVRLPDVCVFLSTTVNVYEQHEAVVECAKVGIPTVAVVDSNVNPTIITYPIPGNDDSPASINLYLRLFEKAINLGKKKRKEMDELMAKMEQEKVEKEKKANENGQFEVIDLMK